MKTSPATFSPRQERRLLRIAAQVAKSGFASPERIGCPASQTLESMARRNSGISSSPDVIDHIATCSPCFVEYSGYRASHKRRIRVWSSLALAAFVVILLSLARDRFLLPNRASESQITIARGEAGVEWILDLRLSGVPRGDVPYSRVEKPPRLPARKVSLSIYLPIGSDNGIYEIALINASGRPLIASSGEAKLQNYIEVLPANLDLRRLVPGQYKLQLRRVQEPQGNLYSIVIE